MTLIKAIIAVSAVFFMSEARVAHAACERVVNDAAGYIVCSFDAAKSDIRLFHSDPSGEVFGGFDAIVTQLWHDRHGLLFGMNGGMYHSDYSPVGLYVENGREGKAASTRAGWGNFHLLPNGVFAVGDGEARVMETNAYLRSGFAADYATQSGPMLVIEGAVHPRFLPDSDSLKIRNGVGVDDKGQVQFALSEVPVRFYDFALLFRDRLGCRNALFLDGTISSIFAPDVKRNDRFFPMGPIIGVVGRLSD